MNINLIIVWVMSQAGLLPKIEAVYAAILAAPTLLGKLKAGQTLEVLIEGALESFPFPAETTPVAVADAHAKLGASAVNIGGWLTAVQAILAFLQSIGVFTPKPPGATTA